MFIGALAVLCLNGLVGAEESPSPTLVDRQKYEWVLEEILQQIKALREDVRAIESEVSALDSKVNEMANAKPAIAGRRSAPTQVKLGPHRLGDSKARYAIVEFSDYQCPYCSRHARTVFPRIKKELIDTGSVKYALRDYPLGFHGEAKGASVAVRCAGEQDKYWEMHAEVFANQRKLGDEFYKETAKAFSLDSQAFSTCLANPVQGSAVDQDVAYGNSLGVTGTPKFFVGKVQGDEITDVIVISGAQSFAAFSGAIERLSKKEIVQVQ